MEALEWSLSAGGGRLFLASDWVLAPNSCCWLKAALVCIEIWKFLLFWVNALIGSCDSLGRLRQRTNYYIMPICSLNSFFFSFCFLADHSVHWTNALNDVKKKKVKNEFNALNDLAAAWLVLVALSSRADSAVKPWPGFGQVQENPNPPAFPSPTTCPVIRSGWLRNVLFKGRYAIQCMKF